MNKWLIDWDDDDFEHPLSDVTRHVIEFVVDLGANTFIDEVEVQAKTADGALVLDNENNLYTAESIVSIGLRILSRRHLCKFVGINDEILWEGFALPPEAELGVQPTATIVLEGKLTGVMSEPYEVFTTDRRSAHTMLEDMANFANVDVGFRLLDQQASGVVRHTGTFGAFALDLQRFINGFVWESERGEVSAVSFDRLVDYEVRLDLEPETYRIFDTGAIGRAALELVRNHVVTRQLSFIGTPNTPVALVGFLLEAQDTQTITTEVTDPFIVRVTNWPTLAELQRLAQTGLVLTNLVTRERSLSVDVRNSTNARIQQTIEVMATANRLQQVRNTSYDNELSIADFSRRAADIPPWFDETSLVRGINTVRNLSQPLQSVELVVNFEQTSIGLSDNVEAIRIGHALNVVVVDIDGIAVQAKMLVVGVTLQGRQDEPDLKILRLLRTPFATGGRVFTWGATRWGQHVWGREGVRDNTLTWHNIPLEWRDEILTWEG